jgi:hypothetical protein
VATRHRHGKDNADYAGDFDGVLPSMARLTRAEGKDDI